MNKLRSFIYSIITFFCSSSTLTGRTEKLIRSEFKYLYKVRKERGWLRFRNQCNHPVFVVVVVSLAYFGGIITAHQSENIVTKWLNFLQLFDLKMDDSHDDAHDIIQGALGAGATIIGLTFVVTGFLFQILQNRAKTTFNELYILTRMYYVFAISILGLVTLVFLNLHHHSVTTYVAKSYAILSSWILIWIILVIGRMFYKLLKYMDPDSINAIAKKDMFRTAKFARLEECYSIISEFEYSENMTALGYQLGVHSLFNPSAGHISIDKGTNIVILDVFFPLLNFTAKRIVRDSKAPRYIPISYKLNINNSYTLFMFDNSVEIGRIETLSCNNAFHYSKNIGNIQSYTDYRNLLEKRLIVASRTGDFATATEVLQDLHEIYEIYYKSRS